MGADFLLAWCVEPSEGDLAAMLERINNLTEDDLENPGITDILDGYAVFDETEALDAIKTRLQDCVEELKNADGFRDTINIEFGDVSLLVSGGMSWGDSPNQTCDAIWDLQNTGLLPFPSEHYVLVPKT